MSATTRIHLLLAATIVAATIASGCDGTREHDAGGADASSDEGRDAGARDGGSVDGGAMDGGASDAGSHDAAAVDAGAVDAAASDAGAADAGSRDAGSHVDASTVDAGSDAGPADAGTFDPCAPLPAGLTTWTRTDTASSGTPDTYFFDVTPGDPFCASITGGGSGAWSLVVSNGTSSGVYCSGSPTCSIVVPPGQMTLLATAVTTDIGGYTMTVRYRPR